MVDVKEIKSIKIVPFTLMSSSISAILAFIGGILFAITLGIIVAVLPSPLGGALAGLGVAAIIAYPILTFLIGLSTVFLSVLLYNMLVPRVGGVKLAMDGNNVAEIPVVPFALILSIIGAIWALIIGLILATALAPITGLIGTSIPLIANATNTSFTGEAFGIGTAALYGFLIIGLPILAFIFGFIWNALFAVFYNYIATRVAKIQLNFAALTEGWHQLTEIPIIPAALALAVISAVFALIQGILNLAAFSDIAAGILSLIGSIIGNFIGTFIVVAIGVFLYNFLAPRIGAIKLELQ
jgi:hypothetical protein